MDQSKSDSTNGAQLGTAEAPLIAVIGMAGRFPGARDVAEFWNNIRDGVESISFPGEEQLRAAGASEADLRNSAYVRAVAILEDIERFDAAFFGFSPKDAAIMDPQHRLFLECAWEALENAGWCVGQFDGRIGVYAGSGFNSYLVHNLMTNQELLARSGLFLLKQTGNDKDVLATRISYQLNLTGPSLAVQTACSTSLVSIHLACQSLLNHECDMALAGGVTIEIPHGLGYLYREGEILSRDGHCRAFDLKSSGTIFGSGLGIVVLRRFEDALRDGDSIRALVRATSINNDGSRKVGFLAPSVAGQVEAILEAQALAGVDARSISMVEAHGTGTAVGDPIEISSLTQAFRQTTEEKRFCAIGSVKTNVGHLDAAAGVAGFIKAVLALEHRQIPPSLNYSAPNPLIDFDDSPFFVNTELREWKAECAPRRAAVTSLGIGGTNAHAILEEAPALPMPSESRDFQLLTLSAKTTSALEAITRKLSEYLVENPNTDLADIAYTLHLGRAPFPHRRTLVSRNASEAAQALLRFDTATTHSTKAAENEPGIIFLFSGQGSQHTGMGRELYESESEFRSAVDYCAELLKPRLGVDLRVIMFDHEDGAQEANQLLSQTYLTQPALFTIEYALAQLWQSFGIRPKAMAGHSIGEYAAACVAGVFSLDSALEIVAERGRLMQSLPAGAMTAVTLSERDVSPLLGKRLSLAGVNGEQQCVVSGPEDAVAELERTLSTNHVSYQRLRTSHAFHSEMMAPILETFAAFVGRFKLSPPAIPCVAGATGDWLTDSEACDPGYWARQLRQAVRFADGVAVLLKDENTLFLEVGPGHALSALVGQQCRSRQRIIASMRSQRESVSDIEPLLTALGRLWAAGKAVDWRGFHAHESRRRLQLPTYPFERRRFWIEPGKPLALTPAADIQADRSSLTSPGLYRTTWKREEPPSIEGSKPHKGTYLIFSDALGLGAAFADVVRSRGERCIELVPGANFVRLDESRFQIDPANRANYDSLIRQLKSTDNLPRTIVHFWTILEETDAARIKLPEIENLSFYSLLFLAQSLGDTAVTQDIELGVVSNALTQVAEEKTWCPERALLAGPCGVIPKELPNIHCRNIDVVLSPPTSQNGNSLGGNRNVGRWRPVVFQVLKEISAEARHTVVAYRNNRRWIQTVEPLGHRQHLPKLLRDRGVYVITGGLGGIGLVMGEVLAKAAKARLVLVTRTPFCPPERWAEAAEKHDELARQIQKIRTIEAAGGEVLIAEADVCDAAAVDRIANQARERFGEINGVIHGAGLVDDAPLLRKTRSNAAAVIAPKVRGTLNVESSFQKEPLDFFIVISSISSLTAPAGQIDYVAANAFLDTFARAKDSARPYPKVAIQWPRWRDVGLAAHASSTADLRSVHPLLGELVTDDGREAVFETRLSLDRDWIVSEHRIREAEGILPGTGYIEMVRAAIARKEANGALRFRDLQFKAPLRVEPGIEQTVQLVLREINDGYTFSVSARANGERDDSWVECASGRVSIVGSVRPDRCSIEKIRRRCSAREIVPAGAQNEKQRRYIAFGPRWNALKRIHLGAGEALAVTELGAQFNTDLHHYKLHPALFDMATGAAMFLITGYESADKLYVPMSYDSLVVHGALPRRCYSHIRARTPVSAESLVASFDISILDESGVVVVEAENFSLNQIRDPSVLVSRPTEPTANNGDAPVIAAKYPRSRIDRSEGSISTVDGAGFFDRIINGEYSSNTIVFPGDLPALLENSRPRPRGVRPDTVNRSDAPSGEGPSDEIEATLANWWKDLLGLETVSRYDDFFALGGQSLNALRLFALVKETYGIEFSAPVLFDAPTIEKLAQILRKEQTPAAGLTVQAGPNSMPRARGSSMRSGSLVELRPGGPRRLFLVHDGEGETLLYLNLARRMPDDLAVFAIEPRRMERVPLAHTRIEDMAAYYIAEMRRKQSHGPYLLGGLCAGGVIAYEMASQLVDVGESVELVALLESAAPNAVEKPGRIAEQRRGRLKQTLEQARKNERALLKRTAAVAGAVSRKLINALRWEASSRCHRWSVHARFALLHELLKQHLPWPRFIPRLGVRQIYECAQARYQPKPLSIRSAVLVRARTGEGDDTPYREIYADDTLGWSALTSGLAVVDADGGHSTMLEERFVSSLAAALIPYLQRPDIQIPVARASEAALV
jgi:acyl transferase domain-containing protein/thioesterase domain-containing protein/acyl carrier protein